MTGWQAKPTTTSAKSFCSTSILSGPELVHSLTSAGRTTVLTTPWNMHREGHVMDHTVMPYALGGMYSGTASGSNMSRFVSRFSLGIATSKQAVKEAK